MTPSTPAPKATHIVVLLDRSGSMETIASDIIGGYNTFIKTQREAGADATVTLVQFDSEDSQETVYEGLPIAEVPSLSAKTFIPRGSTPLFDAMGKLVARIREQRALDTRPTDEQPDVIFVTITDGEENDSTEFSLQQVRQLTGNCQSDGWTFVYLSAGLDAFGDAGDLGVNSGRARAFRASKAGADAMFGALSTNMTALRDKKRLGLDTRDDDFFDDDKVKRILGEDED